MIVLVYGGSGSGKSAFAEKRITELNNKNKLYYLATMHAFDDEDLERIKRHRKLRDGKGFITLEQPQNIGKILDKVRGEKSDILLECMSNLVANEMFDEEEYDVNDVNQNDENKLSIDKAQFVFDKIKADISKLRDSCDNLVIVSNNIFEDGCTYDESVENYMGLLGDINRYISMIGDEVWEVVAGIPIRVK